MSIAPITSVDQVVQQTPLNFRSNTGYQPAVNNTPQQDEYVPQIVPPNLGFWRLATGFLTDKQVAQINQSGKLPPNAKFTMNGVGSYSICNNIMGIRVGTQTLPAGFEVKKNFLGQAVVLPKNSDGLLIR